MNTTANIPTIEQKDRIDGRSCNQSMYLTFPYLSILHRVLKQAIGDQEPLDFKYQGQFIDFNISRLEIRFSRELLYQRNFPLDCIYRLYGPKLHEFLASFPRF